MFGGNEICEKKSIPGPELTMQDQFMQFEVIPWIRQELITQSRQLKMWGYHVHILWDILHCRPALSPFTGFAPKKSVDYFVHCHRYRDRCGDRWCIENWGSAILTSWLMERIGAMSHIMLCSTLPAPGSLSLDNIAKSIGMIIDDEWSIHIITGARLWWNGVYA